MSRLMGEIRRSRQSERGIILVEIIELVMLRTSLIDSIGSSGTLVAESMNTDALRTTYDSLVNPGIA